MAKIVFFPIGNADSTFIHLNDDRFVLVDYCNKPLDQNDRRVNLEVELKKYLLGSDEIDLVAFTHAHDDHIHGAENIFWLKHAQKYQDNGRIKIKTLAIPAYFLLEAGLEGTARVLREEARYRVREGKDILIFGNPESLTDWLIDEGIRPETRQHLIVKAGTCLPGFDRNHGQVEFFIHSPFSFNMEGEDVPRNSNCLVCNVTFFEGDKEHRLMLGGDAEWEDWLNIIYITCKKGNEKRLDWGAFHIPHHCSYTALSDEKGKEKTVPKPEIEGLYNRATRNCILISPSEPIPSVDTIKCPHKQAAAFYKEIAGKFGDEDNFIVTMDWPPHSDKPKPLEIETTLFGFRVKKNVSILGGSTSVIGRPSPRLG